MANEIQTARDIVKTKLDIATANTDFDTLLTASVEQAIPRVNPYLQNRLAEDVSVTLSDGDDSFTLPVAGSSLQAMMIRLDSSDPWQEFDNWRQWNDTIYIEQDINTTTYVKVLAKSNYAVTDAGLAEMETDSPASLLPVYMYAMSEFAVYLVGNKRKFNIYQQMNGVRTLNEMQELAEFYENRAIRILEDEISAEGR